MILDKATRESEGKPSIARKSRQIELKCRFLQIRCAKYFIVNAFDKIPTINNNNVVAAQ